ncbi:adenylate/guanylate cyclase domain-containing protein [Clostridium sp. UBA4395]|uniref:adenylate/guanylate cyclase domain-containing protein n=1 Tax=Clostridium sp. UBA4395 TaxID=1946360 RepID=UPI0032165976
MEKNKGVHLYVSIKNLMDVIRQEEEKDDDLKRTLHRLQTYFVGHSKLIKVCGGKVEKYTGGRSHIVFELNDDSEMTYETILETAVACFIFNNKIFNNLSKYASYPSFSVHAGMDYGDYFDYDIDDSINSVEYTTIGGVANNSAKIQSYAPKDYVYITKKFIDELSAELKEKFIELTEEEKECFSEKIRSKRFYKAHYKDIFDEEYMEKIEERLDDVKKRVEDESKSLNLGDITFESCAKQLSFDGLSLKGKNKRIEEGGVICADIRGFTRLFYINDQNLDDLKDVMEKIYDVMGSVINDTEGTKVQYQGDRIVAVYNDFSGGEDAIVRMLKAAFKLNSKIQELNDNTEVQEKLNNKKISIGIGCSLGKIIATRLGLNGYKHNMVLSDSYKRANKCEDEYAEFNKVVIWKHLKEEIDNKADETEDPKYLALQELFTSISTTGYYKSSATIEEYEEKVTQKEELANKASKVFSANVLKSSTGRASNVNVNPWGIDYGRL